MTIRERLRGIREPKEIKSKAASAAASAGFLLLGAGLGAFAKHLDIAGTYGSLNLAGVFNDFPIWLLAALIIAVFSFTPVKAAVNVFLFYAGMNAAYHIWTIYFGGFDPGGYMMIWYALTAVSPILAVICWYARGEGAAALAADALILAVLATFCFSFGWIYFGFKGVLNALFFTAAAAALYRSPKQTALSFAASLPLAFLLSPLNPVK